MAPFGLFSGRVCHTDAAPAFASLCNPPTSLKHDHSFITKPRINVDVCTSTQRHIHMNVRV